MDRRGFLKSAAAASLGLLAGTRASTWAASAVLPHGLREVRPRPGEPGWPGAAERARLDRAVGGRLLQLQSPFAACTADTMASSCRALLQQLGNPFYLGDQSALRLARHILGTALRAAARGQRPLRPRGTLHGAPWGGQRGLERGWFQAPAQPITQAGQGMIHAHPVFSAEGLTADFACLEHATPF